MFIDEGTGVKIHADLDSTVIHATHRTQDLVPAFLEVLRDTPEYVQIVILPPFPLIPTEDDDPRWDTEEMSYLLNEDLFDALNKYAPEGYYFGAHPGDGSDFGYWKNEEEI